MTDDTYAEGSYRQFIAVVATGMLLFVIAIGWAINSPATPVPSWASAAIGVFAWLFIYVGAVRGVRGDSNE